MEHSPSESCLYLGMLYLQDVQKGLGVRIGCFAYLHELGKLLVKLRDPGLLVVAFQLVLKELWVFFVDTLVPQVLGYAVYYKVLRLFLQASVSLIADNLVLNLLDTVFTGLVIVDEVATNPSVIFYLGLAKGVDAVVHSSSLNPPPPFFRPAILHSRPGHLPDLDQSSKGNN